MRARAQQAADGRTGVILQSLRDQIHRQTDQMFVVLMSVQWVFAVAAALWVSPRSWEGASSTLHPHVWTAFFLGGAISVPPIVAAAWWPGRTATRYLISVAQMLMSAVLIHVTGGRIETHFHIFGSLAFLAFYRDYRLLIPATLVVAADHLIRGAFWPESVYGVVFASPWRTLEHAGWVVFEDAVLTLYCIRAQRELWQIAQRTAHVESSEERYRAIVGQMADSIVVFDAVTREILEFNPAFANRAGAPAEKLIGLVIDKTMVGGAAGVTLEDEIAAIMETGTPVISERTMRRFDGTLIDASCSLSPTTFSGRPAICAVVHDISQRKRVEVELARARDAAIESARLKAEFLANMSHEIRTPMNGVVGMAGLLLETPLTTEQRDFANTIQSSADGLLTIINDILDFSKAEAGKLQFDSIPFDLRQALEGAVDVFAEPAARKNLELMLLIDASVPTAIVGDPGRLRQVVVNLVGNALKFTPQGEIVLSVSNAGDPTTDRARLRFEIRDTGIGIPEAIQARLFEAFVQADGSTTRKYGGTGLGLAISRRLVECMHGTIGVTSTPGEGSTFWFLAEFDRQSGNDASAVPEAGDLRGQRVLVVDDNETNRKILHHQLAIWGAKDTCVGDAAEALDALRAAAAAADPFVLVILDRQMPEVDGLMLARSIRQDPQFQNVPLVLMTSLGDFGEQNERAALGLAACLFKPVKAAQLREALVTAIAPANDSLDGSSRATPARRAIKARVLVAEDNVVNQKVALLQLRRLGCYGDAVGNGLEAVKALKQIPYDLVLMDCQMPELDGFEATRVIRASGSAHRNIPIVAMTANALDGDRDRCVAAGMNDYLCKPVKIEDLATMLERWAPVAAS